MNELEMIAAVYADNHDIAKYTIEDGCIVYSDPVNIYRYDLREWAVRHNIDYDVYI